MRRRTLVSVAVVSAALAMAIPAPAQAYDRDAYAYAAKHMIDRAAIPKVLGNFDRNLTFSATAVAWDPLLCDLPGATADSPPTAVKFPAGSAQYTANYSSSGKFPTSLQVVVNQYPSASAAISAFNTLKKRARTCTGSSSSSYVDEESGVRSTSSTLLVNGKVPSVTTAGVASIFVNRNNRNESTSGAPPYIDDNYAVYSLFGDVIIATTYYPNDSTNISTEERKAVNQVAFHAETAWLG